MILFRSHSEIDKEKWDACIRESANGMIYGYSWYLDIVSPGWAGLIEDAYTAVFPLTQRKSSDSSIYINHSSLSNWDYFPNKRITPPNFRNF